MAIKALVALSGGMDSATVLGNAIDDRREVSTFGFYYGSKHNPFENAAAMKIASYYGVPFRLIDLSGAMQGFRSNLMAAGGPIPEGHYEQDNMKQTVVPNRNMIFLSILTGLAASNDITEIWLGVHRGDHQIYPDCRPEFIQKMREAIKAATQWNDTDPEITLKTPFLQVTKKEILQAGLNSYKIQVPYIYTRTCYSTSPTACGRCGSCQERLEAFASLGMTDPIPYVSRELLPKTN